MRTVYLIVIAVSLSLLLVACGGANSSTPTATIAPVTISLSTDPNPAMQGDVTLTLVIKDENGSPIEGARVDVSVDHTDMTGMGMSGPAIEQGEGKYAINANFSMSGTWNMTVYVRTDSLDYKEDIELKIQ